jgi:hypothetical protein
MDENELLSIRRLEPMEADAAQDDQALVCKAVYFPS